ncbi:MAG: hypothetical protein HONDAALG_02303 [Gammaproteobacteria bacterium]|nr:hypothetical protein [Gammaproteobacteria bacterium]
MAGKFVDFLINLAAAAFGGFVTWAWRTIHNKRLRDKRLQQIQTAAKEGEIAICIRVGGYSDPLPDVRNYLQAHHPNIAQILVYQASGEALDEPATAARIVEDVYEGIRAYGEGAISRLHFFPSGMVAYSPIIFTILSNWGKVVVYHKKTDAYVPLYEVDKDRRRLVKREFKSLNAWQVVTVQATAAATVGTTKS